MWKEALALPDPPRGRPAGEAAARLMSALRYAGRGRGAEEESDEGITGCHRSGKSEWSTGPFTRNGARSCSSGLERAAGIAALAGRPGGALISAGDATGVATATWLSLPMVHTTCGCMGRGSAGQGFLLAEWARNPQGLPTADRNGAPRYKNGRAEACGAKGTSSGAAFVARLWCEELHQQRASCSRILAASPF